MPTLYMHGLEDGCIGPEIAAGQAEHFAAPLRSIEIPHAGHFLHLEAPELVESEIVRYLVEA